MIAHYEVEQGTEAWFKQKWGKVGGTLASGLFVESDTLANTLLAELTEDFAMDDDGYTSPAMQRGTELEPVAREQLEQYMGIKLLPCGWIQSDHPLLGISPDGISIDETVCAEIKCPGSKRHIDTVLADEIPLDNIDQCVHYFTVNPKLEALYFCSFRPESKVRPLFVKKLTRDSLVNSGTKAKPLFKTVDLLTKIANNNAIVLQNKINQKLEKLCTL